jgi:hypothetical protein
MLIEAVVVNHDTSLFAELALRSLVESCAGSVHDVRITVRDNHSTDDRAGSLREVASGVGAAFELTRWPAREAKYNTHGDVLRDFVLDHRDADAHLFVDCDIDFEEPGVVDTMAAELGSTSSWWAVQARFSSLEAVRGEGATRRLNDGGSAVHLAIRGAGHLDAEDLLVGRLRPRCHPGATLVRSSPLLLHVASTLGFGCALNASSDPEIGGFFDTLGLATAVMAVQGFDYGISTASVHHFFNVSYDRDKAAGSVPECLRRLQRFGSSQSGRFAP